MLNLKFLFKNLQGENYEKITVEMACSINGLIATEDGEEDFLSFRGWEIMLELLKEYDVLIWERKTWDNIKIVREQENIVQVHYSVINKKKGDVVKCKD